MDIKDKAENAGKNIEKGAAKVFNRIKNFFIRKLGPDSNFQQYIKRMWHALTDKTVHDETLERAFVGKKYDIFKRRKFNVPGFFLSSLYMFYRRMYFSALVVFAVNIAMIVITHNIVPHTAPNIAVDVFHQVLIGIMVGFLVNKYYLWTVARKIMRIRARYPGRKELEMKGICEVLGGVRLKASGLGMLLEIVVVMAMFVVFAVQFVVQSLSGEVVKIQSTMEEASTEVEEVIHGEIPSFVEGLVTHIFGNKKAQ